MPDHTQILSKALETLRKDLIFQNVKAFDLLPEKFTLFQLQSMYEVILGKQLDKRNFRKKIEKAEYIVPLDEKQQSVAHKPARLYRFDKQMFEKNREEVTSFFL